MNVLRFSFWTQANQGLNVHLSASSALTLQTIDPSDPNARTPIAQRAGQRPTFTVLNPPSEARHLAAMGKSPDDYFQASEKVWSYQRPGGKSALEVWQLKPP